MTNKWMSEMIKVYPFNLVAAVLGMDMGEIERVHIPGVIEAISLLSDREIMVLELRFRERMTLEKAAREFSITRERVRQIEAKALRKLRHPSRRRMFYGVSATLLAAEQEKRLRLESEYEDLTKVYEEEFGKYPEKEIISAALDQERVMGTDIEKLGLSVRSYNCLMRAGKNTLRDLSLMTYADLTNVRNLGRKSSDEIIGKLREYGITINQDGGDSNEGN